MNCQTYSVHNTETLRQILPNYLPPFFCRIVSVAKFFSKTQRAVYLTTLIILVSISNLKAQQVNDSSLSFGLPHIESLTALSPDKVEVLMTNNHFCRQSNFQVDSVAYPKSETYVYRNTGCLGNTSAIVNINYFTKSVVAQHYNENLQELIRHTYEKRTIDTDSSDYGPAKYWKAGSKTTEDVNDTCFLDVYQNKQTAVFIIFTRRINIVGLTSFSIQTSSQNPLLKSVKN